MAKDVAGTTRLLKIGMLLAGLALIFGTMYLETKTAIVVFAIGWLVLVAIVLAHRFGRI